MNIYPSFRGQFINKGQHCIEMCCYNEQIIYFASYDSEQIKEWLGYFTRAKKFYEWYQTVLDLL